MVQAVSSHEELRESSFSWLCISCPSLPPPPLSVPVPVLQTSRAYWFGIPPPSVRPTLSLSVAMILLVMFVYLPPHIDVGRESVCQVGRVEESAA